MRKHGWQPPYHPLQVVAVCVFLALGFSFYVFFAPFVGKQCYQYIVMGLYTPLVSHFLLFGFLLVGIGTIMPTMFSLTTERVLVQLVSEHAGSKWAVLLGSGHNISCAFGLYIWCAGADPADLGVFKSKKYVNIPEHKRLDGQSKLGGESTSSIHDANADTDGKKAMDKDMKNMVTATAEHTMTIENNGTLPHESSWCVTLLAFLPCTFIFKCSNLHDESSEQHASEGDMFYCSLCEVEVSKYSKHCRVCDKCVDRFDHHCRWLNNCIGKKNYRNFIMLMLLALLLLILQWSTGIFVLVRSFLGHKGFSAEIATKLGSSFSVVPYNIVVAASSILALIATLPIVQLFFFHILLIKKGISTYDYIVAMREQEQQGVGRQQSPQMSETSSLTRLSSASSYNTFHRGAWCTPPRLFVEDQFDVVPTDTSSVSSLGKKTGGEFLTKMKAAPVKISPWALARLNADDVSQAAAEARKKSKILQPVVRRNAANGLDKKSSFAKSDSNIYAKPDYNRKRGSKHIRLPPKLPTGPLSILPIDNDQSNITEMSTNANPLQLEAQNALRTSLTVSSGIVTSSPGSSLDSPDPHQFRVFSSTAEEARRLVESSSGVPTQLEIPFSRSTSDGYEASGGEDSDRIPSGTTQRSVNWSNALFSSYDEMVLRLEESDTYSHGNNRAL